MTTNHEKLMLSTPCNYQSTTITSYTNIFIYFFLKMYLSEINIPDWAEKHDPSCMSHSHISQGATNPMLHKQNHHQSSQWLLSHQWKQSHLQPEPLSSQKWNWTHPSKSTAPTAKSENPCSEYIPLQDLSSIIFKWLRKPLPMEMWVSKWGLGFTR